MPQGDKSKYTDKQKRMAQHIEDGYQAKGVSEDVAEARAWATVNATDGGGKKPGGSGHGQARNPAPAKKGGKKGGVAAHGKKKSVGKPIKSAKSATQSKKKSETKTKKAASPRKPSGRTI